MMLFLVGLMFYVMHVLVLGICTPLLLKFFYALKDKLKEMQDPQ
jgi:hypothetical protein